MIDQYRTFIAHNIAFISVSIAAVCLIKKRRIIYNILQDIIPSMAIKIKNGFTFIAVFSITNTSFLWNGIMANGIHFQPLIWQETTFLKFIIPHKRQLNDLLYNKTWLSLRNSLKVWTNVWDQHIHISPYESPPYVHNNMILLPK